MGYIDDASGRRAEQEIWSAIRKLQTASPLDNASVENGSTRFIGNESLKVLGSAVVSGWLIITGTLKLVGTLLIEGVTTITGALTSTGTALFTGAFTSRGTTRFEGDTTQVGPSHVVGNQDITGTLAVKGVTTLTNDLNVTTGGKIRAGNTFFNPDGTLSATTLLTIQGSAGISLAGTTTVGGSFLVPSLTAGTGAANMFADTAGKLWKASSASRFKIDPEAMDVPDALLDVPVRAWIDMGNAERFAALYDAPRPFTQEQQIDFDGADLSRVPGVIAEEVKAAGGDAFVTCDADGVIEGVAYDRLALARTQILARKLDAAMGLIAELQQKLAD